MQVARGVRVSKSTIWRMVRRLGYTRKKRSVGATGREDWLRAAWRVMVAGTADPRELVFVDEIWAPTHLAFPAL